ncbi:MAG: polyprenyl synthetase family protein [Verrucomicrobia bacterium]|nr:polyprenyl synthetase family protein [Verrucomicrobiota bacterium]
MSKIEKSPSAGACTGGFPAADESPNDESVIEWWFVQGRFSGTGLSNHSFMISLFRHNIAGKGNPPKTAFSSLLSLLDPSVPRHEAHSRIDRALLNYWSAKKADEIDACNLDHDLLTSFLKEIGEHGAPRPIEAVNDSAELSSSPLRIAWRDLQFSQNGGCFDLEFASPQSGCRHSFTLRTRGPRRTVERIGEGSGIWGGMNYFTYPDLELAGDVGGTPVRGRAWLDHQWGDTSWYLMKSSGGRLLGWDWFGINLDDGRDLLVCARRDSRTGKAVGRRAIIWHGHSARATQIDAFEIEPVRRWESEGTRIEYPVAWKIRIPSLDADLEFEPAADNQEIAVFGPSRSVWEGAGTVRGTIAGMAVRGHARGEFHGYGYIFDFQEYLDRFAGRVAGRIEEFFPKSVDEKRYVGYVGAPAWKHEIAAFNETIAAPIWDLIRRKGKCWRPAFVMMMLEAMGKPIGPYELLLCVATELTHTGALIIDDIEDRSVMRRGDASIHLRYGLDVAINAANAAYFMPSLIIDSHKHLTDGQKLRLHEIMMKHFVRAHFGQGLDIYWSANATPAALEAWLADSLMPKILQMYAYKTGSAVAGITECAAVIAGASPEVTEAATAFSRSFGVAFQIIDDVHNFSESPKWRKSCGEDIAEGKVTYVICAAMRRLGHADRTRLMNILCSREGRKDPSMIAEGTDLVRRSGALDTCKKEALAMFHDAWDIFSGRVPSSEPKILLHCLCCKMVELAYEV